MFQTNSTSLDDDDEIEVGMKVFALWLKNLLYVYVKIFDTKEKNSNSSLKRNM